MLDIYYVQVVVRFCALVIPQFIDSFTYSFTVVGSQLHISVPVNLASKLASPSFLPPLAAPIKNAQLPAVKPTDPWDGKDGELPQEEDWDLSDVDLDDESSKDEL